MSETIEHKYEHNYEQKLSEEKLQEIEQKLEEEMKKYEEEEARRKLEKLKKKQKRKEREKKHIRERYKEHLIISTLLKTVEFKPENKRDYNWLKEMNIREIKNTFKLPRLFQTQEITYWKDFKILCDEINLSTTAAVSIAKYTLGTPVVLSNGGLVVKNKSHEYSYSDIKKLIDNLIMARQTFGLIKEDIPE